MPPGKKQLKIFVERYHPLIVLNITGLAARHHTFVLRPSKGKQSQIWEGIIKRSWTS